MMKHNSEFGLRRHSRHLEVTSPRADKWSQSQLADLGHDLAGL